LRFFFSRSKKEGEKKNITRFQKTPKKTDPKIKMERKMIHFEHFALKNQTN